MYISRNVEKWFDTSNCDKRRRKRPLTLGKKEKKELRKVIKLLQNLQQLLLNHIFTAYKKMITK